MISSSTLLAAIASALTLTSATTLTPRQTKNNAIYTPGLNELVPVGTPYQITWKPDVPGLVNIYLLRGPAENLKVLSTIAEDIPNTGSYSWTPDTTLEDDKTHYGLNLTMPAVPGEFQYSTQFGISNPNPKHEDTETGSSSAGSNGTVTASDVESSTNVTAGASETLNSTADATATSSNSTVPPSGVPVPASEPAGPYSNETATNKTTSVAPPASAPTNSVKGNGTTGGTKPKPSSGADAKVATGLSAIALAIGAALMI
ncbi:GPI anchored serine-threonine rich protein [Venturia nashicola]|uniref:GPI anchored serine-threonine rich protein n=1 Tax=Venturia nashicola TaxID=86259 RepID=A0A4Z1P0F5_9PEZI|nr:GPI anchored serine-threonine rich protein [Venturia nashicola]